MRLVGGHEATIWLPPRISPDGWDHLLEYLGVMKAGYVRDGDPHAVIDPRRGDDSLGIA